MRAPAWMQEEMLKAMRVLMETGAGAADAAAPHLTGLLGQSFFEGAPGSITVVTPNTLVLGSSVPYAAAQNFGGAWFPPPAALQAWAEQRGLGVVDFYSDIPNGVGFLIARAISERGLPGHHFFEKMETVVTAMAPRLFKRAMINVVRRIGG
jgi:hypothetical protein